MMRITFNHEFPKTANFKLAESNRTSDTADTAESKSRELSESQLIVDNPSSDLPVSFLPERV